MRVLFEIWHRELSHICWYPDSRELNFFFHVWFEFIYLGVTKWIMIFIFYADLWMCHINVVNPEIPAIHFLYSIWLHLWFAEFNWWGVASCDRNKWPWCIKREPLAWRRSLPHGKFCSFLGPEGGGESFFFLNRRRVSNLDNNSQTRAKKILKIEKSLSDWSCFNSCNFGVNWYFIEGSNIWATANL